MSKKEFLIYMVEHQDNSFINALYNKAIALLTVNIKPVVSGGK